MKPILKWAGGKTQLLDILKKQMNIDNQFNTMTYIEPFIGAGALFLDLIEDDIFSEYIINDINSKLINVYMIIRDNPEELLNQITSLSELYMSYEDDLEAKETLFYDIRTRFNELQKNSDLREEELVLLAAYFIFLNKTCFNGLYRENSKGEFNVPFGKFKKPAFFEREEIVKLSNMLNKRDEFGNRRIKILNLNYFELEELIDSNCFVYMDPPYRPITAGGFNSYNKSSFNDDSQIELSEFYKLIDKKGAKLMLSNSDPKMLDESDTFFDDLYSSYDIRRIKAKRNINSNGAGRGLINELLITNYKDKGKQVKLFENIYEGKSKDDIFEDFMRNLKPGISGWDYLVDWSKVASNTKSVEMELNILNYLVGKEDIVNETKNLLKKYPEVLDVIPIVVASRKNEFNILDPSDDDMFRYKTFNFKSKKDITDKDCELATEFLDRVGFLDLLKNKNIKNLVDYTLGVEVGLDTNGRKNRTGTSMENFVEIFVKDMCSKNGWSYITQATVKKIYEMWEIEVPTDKSQRKYDFVINNNGKIILVEVNFYNDGGSKLKSVANEFIKLDKYINDGGFTFCWITDGPGWNKSRLPLRDAFDKVDYIFNLEMVDKGLLEYIIKNL